MEAIKEIWEQTNQKMQKVIEVANGFCDDPDRPGQSGDFGPGDRGLLRFPDAPEPVASVSTPEPRMLLVQPWDKSIRVRWNGNFKADLGFNPTNDGNVIRLVVPS